MMYREEKNIKLLKLIEGLVHKFPEQRLGQILVNYVYGIKDPFYNEPEYDINVILRRFPELEK